MSDADGNNDMNKEVEGKKIVIQGTNNRYQVKKLIQAKTDTKRKAVEHWNIPMETFSDDTQWNILSQMCEPSSEINMDSKDLNLKSLIQKQIENKLLSYKGQDIIKKRLDESQFVSFQYVICKLNECRLQCFFCKEKMFILYELTREMKQWTLDRMDNDKGHNENNVVISCLQCNLIKRRRGTDAFLFTKQMILVKKDE